MKNMRPKTRAIETKVSTYLLSVVVTLIFSDGLFAKPADKEFKEMLSGPELGGKSSFVEEKTLPDHNVNKKSLNDEDDNTLEDSRGKEGHVVSPWGQSNLVSGQGKTDAFVAGVDGMCGSSNGWAYPPTVVDRLFTVIAGAF